MKGYIIRTIHDLVLEHEATKTIIPQLFGKFWMEGELAFLFSTTNAGKTLLASDIGIAIASGNSWWPDMEILGPQKVVLFQFELTQAQYSSRYMGAGDVLPDGLSIISFDLCQYESKLDLLHSVLIMIQQMQSQPDAPKVFIIDNITFIMDSSMVSQKWSLSLTKELKTLKEMYGLSILLLAHSTKIKFGKPIELANMGGSMILHNFADSIFAIGESIWDSGTKYVKQLKCRSCSKMDMVLTVEIAEKPYLHFEFLGWNSEEEHLGEQMYHEAISPEGRAVIAKLRVEDGLSIRDIAAKLGLSKSSVGRFCKANGI